MAKNISEKNIIDKPAKSADRYKRTLSRHKNNSIEFGYLSVLGHKFTKKVADSASALLNTYSRRDKTKIPGQWYGQSKFLTWLSSTLPVNFPELADKLRKDENLNQSEWQKVVNHYRSELTASEDCNKMTSGGDTTKTRYIDDIRSLLDHLANEGIVPKVQLKSVRNSGQKAHPKRGIAERPRKTKLSDSVRGHLEKQLTKDTGGSDIARVQRKDCITSLASENIPITNGELNHAEELYKLNNKRLSDLRYAMEEELISAYEKFEHGKILLQQCDMDYETELLPKLEAHIENPHKVGPDRFNWQCTGEHNKKSDLFRQFVDVERNIGLSRFLNLVDNRYDGFLPCKPDWEISWFYSSLYSNNALGNRKTLQHYLGASSEIILAAIIILLIDTGLNVTDVMYIKRDCINETDDPNLYELKTTKARSDYTEHITIIKKQDENRISSYKVIEIISNMTERLRVIAAEGGVSKWRTPVVPIDNEDVCNFLFIRYERDGKKIVAGYTSFYSQYLLDKFCERYELLNGLRLTLDCIRPSVLMKVSNENDFEANIAQFLANHKSKKTTSSYIFNRYPSRSTLQRMIRDFQTEWEAVAISNIPNAARELNYSPEEISELLDSAIQNGLGVVCLQQIEEKNKSAVNFKTNYLADLIDESMDPNQMTVFVASEANLFDTGLLVKYLEYNLERLWFENPQRCEKFWLPKLAKGMAIFEMAKAHHSVNPEMIKSINDAISKIDVSTLPKIS